MTILAQHGHAKSDKIEVALREGIIQGAVLSPRHEEPEQMQSYLASLRDEFPDAELLFDPQFHLSALGSVSEGKLPDYSYYRPGLSRRSFIRHTDLETYARETLEFQASLPVSSFIGPAVWFGDFRDPWSQIALALGEETIAAHNALALDQGLLVPLVFNETALMHRDALNEFLDVISVWDVAGFYLVVERESSSYPALMVDDALASLMYTAHVLGPLNGFHVIYGYLDLESVPVSALGAAGCATGWYNNLRQYSIPYLEPGIRRQPRARYTSSSLLGSILVVPELVTTADLGLSDLVATNSSRDAAVLADPANAEWGLAEACLHNWEALSGIVEAVTAGSSSVNLDEVMTRIAAARGSYGVLMTAGVPFEMRSGPQRMEGWQRAIESLRAELGL